MRKIVISEEEQKHIKKLHNILEQVDNPLQFVLNLAMDTFEKLRSGEIQPSYDENEYSTDSAFTNNTNNQEQKIGNNSSDLSSPLDKFIVTSKFGAIRKGISKSSKPHPGTDLRAPSGSKLKAIQNGRVIDSAIRNDSCGGTLYIDHQNGFKSRFCHLKQINVNKGDKVTKGQIVAYTGGGFNDTGKGLSTGPHLHFELYKDGTLVDPEKFIK